MDRAKSDRTTKKKKTEKSPIIVGYVKTPSQ